MEWLQLRQADWNGTGGEEADVRGTQTEHKGIKQRAKGTENTKTTSKTGCDGLVRVLETNKQTELFYVLK